MDYKLIVLAPSCGGKSSLMRYLRKNTDIHVVENDEEVMKANNNDWPSTDKYHSFVDKTFNEVISRNKIVYLMKDLSPELLRKARDKGFKAIILKLTIEQLNERNTKRMKEEGYEDASMWFEGQLKQLDELSKEKLIDGYIDGNLATEQIADRVIKLAESF